MCPSTSGPPLEKLLDLLATTSGPCEKLDATLTIFFQSLSLPLFNLSFTGQNPQSSRGLFFDGPFVSHLSTPRNPPNRRFAVSFLVHSQSLLRSSFSVQPRGVGRWKPVDKSVESWFPRLSLPTGTGGDNYWTCVPLVLVTARGCPVRGNCDKGRMEVSWSPCHLCSCNLA